MLNLITSAKSCFSNKGARPGCRGEDVGIFFWGGHHPPHYEAQPFGRVDRVPSPPVEPKHQLSSGLPCSWLVPALPRTVLRDGWPASFGHSRRIHGEGMSQCCYDKNVCFFFFKKSSGNQNKKVLQFTLPHLGARDSRRGSLALVFISSDVYKEFKRLPLQESPLIYGHSLHTGPGFPVSKQNKFFHNHILGNTGGTNKTPICKSISDRLVRKSKMLLFYLLIKTISLKFCFPP